MSSIKSTLNRTIRRLLSWEGETPEQRLELRRRQALRIALNDKIDQAQILKHASEEAQDEGETERLKELSKEREAQAQEMKKDLDKRVVNAEAEVYRREARHAREGGQH